MIDDTRWIAAGPRLATERDALFRESPAERMRRVLLGLAWPFAPKRIRTVLPLVALRARHCVVPSRDLPDPMVSSKWLPEVAGIACDLTVPTLVGAHRRGLHPLSHVLAPKWMSLRERCLLFYPDFRISKTQRAHIRKGVHRVTFDRSFEHVLKACAEPRGKGVGLTWITPRIMHAYADMHDAGYAHSFEVWNRSGELVGGGFGVAIGRYYTLKSMFCREDNSSKVGFTFLNWHLAHWGFHFTDMGTLAPYKLALGCRIEPRSEFLSRLDAACDARTRRGRWSVAADAQTVAAWKPGSRQGSAREVHAPETVS